MAIDAAGEDGIAVHYNFPKDDAPEFVQTFAQWMEDELGITPNDELRVAMYAHAANGGIRIDAHAKTSVPGLFACGEVTGRMHGADRIGGSQRKRPVFGRIAKARAPRITAPQHRPVSMRTASSRVMSASG
ncbi:MAG: FAD-binding protein [Collinsella aerofaciens]